MGDGGAGELWMVLWLVNGMMLPFTPWALIPLAILTIVILI